MTPDHVIELGKLGLDCLIISELDLGRVCHCIGEPCRHGPDSTYRSHVWHTHSVCVCVLLRGNKTLFMYASAVGVACIWVQHHCSWHDPPLCINHLCPWRASTRPGSKIGCKTGKPNTSTGKSHGLLHVFTSCHMPHICQ